MIISPTGVQAVTQAQIVAGLVLVSVNAGMLNKVIVTTTTTAAQAITFVDSDDGQGSPITIAIIPGGTAAGTIFAYDIPVIDGITITQNAALAAGAITVVFS